MHNNFAQIRKRDGRLETFHPEKVTWAIFKAAAACGSSDYEKAEELTSQVVSILAAKITQGTPYYTNSTQLPVGYADDLFEAIELQDALQAKYTGGTVLRPIRNFNRGKKAEYQERKKYHFELGADSAPLP